jgi:hypothetical protein
MRVGCDAQLTIADCATGGDVNGSVLIDFPRLTAAAAICTALAVGASCGDNVRPPKRDIAALSKIVRLPINPVEVWFDSLPRGATGMGPADWTFVAVMRFDPTDLSRFLESTTLTQNPDARYPKKDLAAWFPATVSSAFTPASADHMQVRGRRFDATPFSTKPSTAGSFFVIDGAPFIVLRRTEQ